MNKTLAALALALVTQISTAAPDSIATLPEAEAFARDLEQRHGFAAATILGQFAEIRPNARVLQLIAPPTSPTQRSWERYRPRFVNEQRIAGGVRFWQDNAVTLARARALYGVPEEVIVAIIGVETVYGRNTGGFSVLEALATLAFQYPRRADYFRTELEQFLLLTRENGLDPLAVKGSFAGAIGIPQFMPGSQRRYAVDFDGDQRVDLANSVDDAIGSVARFLEQHGWQAGQPVAVPANLPGTPDASLLEAGIRPSLRAGDLFDRGILAAAAPESTVTLVDLVSPERETEYWLGFENFYVITRYNRSSFYAMSVYQLAEEIRRAMPANGAAKTARMDR
ncbi:lytic murein transglycosylase B [Azonexus hydrophilus]|uniref:Lytic murein transglycosylase B n=1 Tax=Azonexus hydrophilus TaxID=418702 RepID=A0A1R1I874_9RHOO|nr:lytic murein transglycosylase B [Azonexus hydrophilus]OMG54820.1 lytic murein transglycosylase B [Azonexus hydrophilus]